MALALVVKLIGCTTFTTEKMNILMIIGPFCPALRPFKANQNLEKNNVYTDDFP